MGSFNMWTIVDSLADIIIAHPRGYDDYKKVWKPLGSIIEIGMGESTKVLSFYAIKWNIKHYSCDIKENYCKKPWHPNHVPFNGTSLEFIKKYIKIWRELDPPIIIFIDGNHNYDNAASEVYGLLPVLSDTGIMFLHDTSPCYEKLVSIDGNRKCGTVYKLRQELEKRDDIQIFTWVYTARSTGLSMITNRNKNKEHFQA